MRIRWVTVVVMVGLLVLSIYGFGFVKQSFFPDSTRPQFMVHYWLPQGTHISRTEADVARIEEYIQELDGVTDVSSFVGQGALRFLLSFTPEEANSAYGLLLIGVEDYTIIGDLSQGMQEYFDEHFPDAQVFSRPFVLGPSDPSKIQVRLRGPDPDTLRRLASQVKVIMHADPVVTDVLDDWRQRVPLVRPIVGETQARNAGVTRAEIAAALRNATEGSEVGLFRQGDDLIPILLRSPLSEREDVADLQNVQIYSPVAQKAIPLAQVVLGFETTSENSIIRRRNRLPTITVKCDPKVGQASTVFKRLRPKIEQIPLPQGYELEWGGEYENSGDAQAALKAKLPSIGLLMVLVVVCLFNSIRQPLMIFLTVPLALIGVTVGLLATGQPFGFMAMLGFLSLVGMLIKNAIVLIDEINAQIGTGKDRYEAIVDSGLSRMRPVSLAALTTVLGMIPLLAGAFFVAMAVTIMVGLTFATILTLIVIPVLYGILFDIKLARV